MPSYGFVAKGSKKLTQRRKLHLLATTSGNALKMDKLVQMKEFDPVLSPVVSIRGNVLDKQSVCKHGWWNEGEYKPMKIISKLLKANIKRFRIETKKDKELLSDVCRIIEDYGIYGKNDDDYVCLFYRHK